MGLYRSLCMHMHCNKVPSALFQGPLLVLTHLFDVSQSEWYSERSPPSTDRSFCVVWRITFCLESLSVTPAPCTLTHGRHTLMS